MAVLRGGTHIDKDEEEQSARVGSWGERCKIKRCNSSLAMLLEPSRSPQVFYVETVCRIVSCISLVSFLRCHELFAGLHLVS